MTPQDVRLVQESFRKVMPVRDAVAGAFYARLFEVDPSTRTLFATTDLKTQGAKLMATLALAVNALGHPEKILPEVRALARRHVGYGVSARHYASVGAALMDTLAVGLGEDFTDDVRTAWAAAFTFLAGEMLAAAEPAATA